MMGNSKNIKSHVVKLPGFINETEIGLGDLIKRATSAIGIKSCGGCEQRAAILNRWIVFNGKNSNQEQNK
jgi:hypothetical protein